MDADRIRQLIATMRAEHGYTTDVAWTPSKFEGHWPQVCIISGPNADWACAAHERELEVADALEAALRERGAIEERMRQAEARVDGMSQELGMAHEVVQNRDARIVRLANAAQEYMAAQGQIGAGGNRRAMERFEASRAALQASLEESTPADRS